MRGQSCPRAEAVLPLREISYAWVANASEVLTPGQPVRVVVTWRQSEPNPKVGAGWGRTACVRGDSWCSTAGPAGHHSARCSGCPALGRDVHSPPCLPPAVPCRWWSA